MSVSASGVVAVYPKQIIAGTNVTISETESSVTINATSGGGGGSSTWGSITGTLSSQTDLQAALDGKQPFNANYVIDASYVHTDNNYTTVEKNKLAGLSAQVQADWNASSGVAQILNKPTIPAQFNPIAGSNITLSGTYPDITFNATSGGSLTSGSVVLDFASKATDTSIFVSNPSIIAGQKITVYLLVQSSTNNTADNHWVENIQVFAGNVQAGVGFTVYGKITEGFGHGQYNVGWTFT